MSLSWVQCPDCRESHDIHRLGKPIEIGVKSDGKLTSRLELRVKCGSCGKVWSTKEPTFEEALGRDGENNTPF